MRPLVEQFTSSLSPEDLAARVIDLAPVLLRTGLFEQPHARYSLVTAKPFLTFRSFGSRCELLSGSEAHVQFGNPWRVLDALMARYELLDELDMPFPIGGCFGYWGYPLKNFAEPTLTRQTLPDLEIPDCCVGFYDSLVIFDHVMATAWIVATGLSADGSRSSRLARDQISFWREVCGRTDSASADSGPAYEPSREISSTLSRPAFVQIIERALAYIRAGDIYQVNLSQRLMTRPALSGWQIYQRLLNVSPAPFAAYLDCGGFQLASSSPELFLRLSGNHIATRPIKGTRPRSHDPTRDAQLSYELQTSTKEMAELVMITDLLRNDLGRICEYGSIQVPDLVRLERFAQVQHLVSTVEGRLRSGVTHFGALASCFPGGSVTGAPKIRAMNIIDELEPVSRGPYTGALGYIGFNRESALSIVIRTALCQEGAVYFNVGAGIVADSNPEWEYDETMAKAEGFVAALNLSRSDRPVVPSRSNAGRHSG